MGKMKNLNYILIKAQNAPYDYRIKVNIKQRQIIPVLNQSSHYTDSKLVFCLLHQLLKNARQTAGWVP
jgi:hypothetical protein